MILVVDDDPEFLGTATRALAARANRILTVSSKASAVTIVKRIGSEIGIVLVDLDLGEASGFELIQTIRDIDPSLPVIAVTEALAPLAALDSAEKLGASAVLRKPVDADWGATVKRLRRDRPSEQLSDPLWNA